MAIRPIMVTIDCSDPRTLSAWWAERASASVAEDFGDYIALDLGGLFLAFQRTDDPTPGKNRVHVDFVSDDRAADVDAWVAGGATKVDDHAVSGGPAWTVLADPDGNQFCFVDAHA